MFSPLRMRNCLHGTFRRRVNILTINTQYRTTVTNVKETAAPSSSASSSSTSDNTNEVPLPSAESLVHAGDANHSFQELEQGGECTDNDESINDEDDRYDHHPSFLPQSKRRAFPSAMLPLEAVSVSKPVQQVMSSYVRAQGMRPRDLKQSYKHFQTARARETYKLRGVEVEKQKGRPRVPPVPSPYKAEHVTSYCANRFPGTFAANVHVLAEVKRIVPKFSPASLLDFGSGAGSALLAATRVLTSPSFHYRSNRPKDQKNNDDENEDYPIEQDDDSGEYDEEYEIQSSLKHAWLVDYSSGMLSMSKKIMRSDNLVTEHVKDIMHTASLSEGPPKSRKYDVVCASYSLSEIVRATLHKPDPRDISRLTKAQIIDRDFAVNEEVNQGEAKGNKKSNDEDDSERIALNAAIREKAAEIRLRKIVRSLWRRTAPGGVLVIVEDGTAAGFETVLYAREMLLARYGPYAPSNQRGKSKQAVSDLDSNPIELEGLGIEDQDQDEEELEQGKNKAFARVIAPCIHSRKCPLDGSITRHRICRFVQRLNRTPLQREKFPTHNGFEDEYFSYIAIQKVARNSNQKFQNDPSQLDEIHDNQWARLIRAPLKRRKHIAIDGCTGNAQLERRVISKGNAKPGFFRIARRTRWGDIWPEPPADNCADVNF